MLLKIRNYCYALLILFSLNAVAQADQKDTIRVLFVGNSYTYFWNLPQTLSAIAASQNVIIITRQSTAGGASLKQHWNGEKSLDSRKLIQEGHWDYVILQNHSMSALSDSKEFVEYGQKFAKLVLEHGAKPLFYITWARRDNPLMQQAITDQYRELAKATGSDFVPVGPVWMQARQLRPDIVLYDTDGSHPSPQGVYLTACVFYKKLTGRSPGAVPPRLQTTDKDGEKLYLSILPAHSADFLKQVVEEFDL